MNHKLKRTWSAITVEPSFFLYYITHGIMQVSSQKLYTLKTCLVNQNQTDWICENLSNNNFTDIQKMVQEETASIQAYNGFLQSLPAILFALFAGPFSDRYGRKPVLLISLAGNILLSIVFIINSYFFTLSAEWLLFECLQDVTGGQIVFLVAIFSILVENTNQNNRTMRMAIVSSIGAVGFLLGLNISLMDDQIENIGPVIGKVRHEVLEMFGMKELGSEDWFSWTCLYVFGLAVNFLNVLYVIFKIKQKDYRSNLQNSNNMGSKEQCHAGLLIFFSGFKNVFKKRSGRGRTWILLLIVIINIHYFVSNGASSVTYLFFQVHFRANEKHLLYVMFMFCLTNLLSSFIIIPFVTKKLKWRDSSILIIGNFIVIQGYLIQAVVFDLWAWYMGYFLYSFQTNVLSTYKSFLSKFVEVTEIGSILSVVGVLQAIFAIGSKSLFAKIYGATVSFYPEAFKFVAISMLSLEITLTGIVHFGFKDNEALEKSNDAEEHRQEMENTKL